MTFIKIAAGLPQTNGGNQFQEFEGAAPDGQPFLNITALHALGAGEVGSTYSSLPMPGGMRSWRGIGLESVILFISKGVAPERQCPN